MYEDIEETAIYSFGNRTIRVGFRTITFNKWMKLWGLMPKSDSSRGYKENSYPAILAEAVVVAEDDGEYEEKPAEYFQELQMSIVVKLGEQVLDMWENEMPKS